MFKLNFLRVKCILKRHICISYTTVLKTNLALCPVHPINTHMYFIYYSGIISLTVIEFSYRDIL